MKNIPKRPESLRKEIPYCWKAETRTGRGHNGILQVLQIFYVLILDAGSADVCQLLSDCLLVPTCPSTPCLVMLGLEILQSMFLLFQLAHY